jgi:hypothetical protein
MRTESDLLTDQEKSIMMKMIDRQLDKKRQGGTTRRSYLLQVLGGRPDGVVLSRFWGCCFRCSRYTPVTQTRVYYYSVVDRQRMPNGTKLETHNETNVDSSSSTILRVCTLICSVISCYLHNAVPTISRSKHAHPEEHDQQQRYPS